jgi:hypothetical protein
MLTRSHARSIGWAAILAVCFALTVALSFRVNAVKSQVRLTERRIAQLQVENGLLETEFETRANQQQLTALNEVDFGYQAPTPAQYFESERQLADLGKPRGPDAPPMIRVAANDAPPAGPSVLPAMVNPLTGKTLGADQPRANKGEPKAAAKPAEARLAERGSATLVERLSRVEQLSHMEKSPKVIDRKVPGLAPRLAAKADAKTKADPKAKSAPKLAKAEIKPAPAKAKAADPKLASRLAKAAAPKSAAPKSAAKPVIKVALKAPAKAHPGKSDRVAIE